MKNTKTNNERNEMKSTATNKHGYTSEQLRDAAEYVRSLRPGDLVREFLAYKHSCAAGTYAGMILNLINRETYCVNEPSRSCSTEEYFCEEGIMSRKTILSGTRDHWSPSPDDGFEWSDGDDYLWNGSDPGHWITSEQAEDKAQELFDAMDRSEAEKYVGQGVDNEDGDLSLGDFARFLEALRWEWFSVSDTPVDGWGDEYMERELESHLNELAERLETEARELEASAV